MIATVRVKGPAQPPCVVYWTGRSGLLSITTRTYCNVEVAAGDAGVTQLPDKSPVCADCKRAVLAAEAAVESATTSSTTT